MVLRSLSAVLLFCSFWSCNNAPAPKEEVLHRFTDNSGTLIQERIEKTLKTIDSFAEVTDVYRRRDLIKNANEVKDVTDQLCQYCERWQNRIVAASGGKSITEILHPDDTVTVTRLLVKGRGGDTVKTQLQEMWDIMLHLVKDSAGVSKALAMEVVYDPAKPGAKEQDWKTNRFSNMKVSEAIELLNKYKYDAKASEVVILNRLLKDSERRK